MDDAAKHIAAGYDAMPYETSDDPALWPRALLGFGSVFGCSGALGDVLDLGCGTGMQLAGTARQMSGRLVGVDLSGENCRLTRARLAAVGKRAQIHQADLLSLTPER